MTLLDVMEARDGSRPSREQWLRASLSQEITFSHRQNEFHFVPDRDLQREMGGLIVGRIGRKRTSQENTPPESGLKETERTAWHAGIVMIDPSHHDDGQKLAIERDATVASSCVAVLQSLAKALNQSPTHHPYLVEVRAIAEASSFWDFVAEHPVITTLQFEMVAPNMFGIHDDWDADMKELKATENADRARFLTDSKDGLKVDTPRVRKGVEKTARGTASLRARAKDGARYSSSDSVKTVSFEDGDDSITWNELLKRIARRIFNV